MKVYKALSKWRIGAIQGYNGELIGGVRGCDVGELLFYHDGSYHPQKGGYSIMKDTVEDNPTQFKRMKDKPHGYDYYMKKKYTQEQVDKMLKKK